MIGWGEKVPNLTVNELQEELIETDDDGKAVKRLLAAIAYKQGQSPAEIEETFGISQKNIYLWLDRFEERSLEEALYDEPKPGRPAKLSDEQVTELEAILREPPEEAGYDDIQAWTPKFVQHWLKTQFEVEYTLRHVRRLMDDVGLSWRTARPKHYDVDPEKVAEFQDTYKKSDDS
jgi:transposase